METLNKDVQKYLEELGWTYYIETENSPTIKSITMGSDMFGGTWYVKRKELGFNTGTCFYLSFKCNTELDKPVLVTVFEDDYGSYSVTSQYNQYSLSSLEELPIL